MLAGFMLGIDGAIGRVELHQGYDVDPGPTIEAGHASIRQAVSRSIEGQFVPIVIGGGHDYGYPHAAGASDVFGGKIAVINVDAHLDVRAPTPEGITSGSPFYLALEEGVMAPENFIEFGIQEHCNAEPLYTYLMKKKVRIIGLDEARSGEGAAKKLENLIVKFAREGLRTVVSFDVDSVQAAHAPGVSAPQCDGFTPDEFLSMARLAGENPSVPTIGFFELAPSLDDNSQRTTRLVVTALHRFLCGLSRRAEKKSRRQVGVRRLLRKRRS
jgi:formiminoglutamase